MKNDELVVSRKMDKTGDHHEKQYKPHSEKKKSYLSHRHNLDLVKIDMKIGRRQLCCEAESKERRNKHKCLFLKHKCCMLSLICRIST